MYDSEYAQNFECVLNSHNYSDGGVHYFVEQNRNELLEQGFENEVAVVENENSVSDDITAAWENIIENFIYDGEFRLEYDNHDLLYAVPLNMRLPDYY